VKKINKLILTPESAHGNLIILISPMYKTGLKKELQCQFIKKVFYLALKINLIIMVKIVKLALFLNIGVLKKMLVHNVPLNNYLM
jgi:hypothetical protein